MNVEKLKNEAEEKLNNEKEAIVRDYYRWLITDEEFITDAYNEKMKKIEEQIEMLDAGKFKVGYSVDRNGLSIIFDE